MGRARQLGAADEGTAPEVPRSRATSSPAIDTDSEMAEIEAILRKRGIQ